MYITESYWGEYMGGTDDSLTLLEYLAAKRREEIPVGEIFADFGLDTGSPPRRNRWRTAYIHPAALQRSSGGCPGGCPPPRQADPAPAGRRGR